MAKAADVELLASRPICSGKHFTLVAGTTGSVVEALARGREEAGDSLVDELMLAQVHKQVIPATLGGGVMPGRDAVGIIETFTVASGILAGDGAAKGAEIKLVDLRLAVGIGGKSYVILTGTLAEVESAVKLGAGLVSERGLLAGTAVIARPSTLLLGYLV